MFVEISVAVNYLLSHLYTKLPRRRVNSFGEELEKYLYAKFQNHWFPNDPQRDADVRCLNASGPQVSMLLPEAAAVSGLDWGEIHVCLPEGLMITVDPGYVACQFNQSGYLPQAVNKYPSTPLWPSNSLSLSSSGCSSASSSISSTNLNTPPANVSHQVLYCIQDSAISTDQKWSDSLPNQAKRPYRADVEGGNQLATATALSVLADQQDGYEATISQDPYIVQNIASLGKRLWNNELNNEGQQSECADLVVCYGDDGITPAVDLSQLGHKDILDASYPRGLLWNGANCSSENPTILGGNEDQSITSGMRQTTFDIDKLQSPLDFCCPLASQNPDQFNGKITDDFINISTAVNNNSTALNSTKPFVNLFGRAARKSSPTFSQAQPVLTNPSITQYGQKSYSTPSFTAATFAQTKFGSTKLKCHTKRNNNRIISPTTVQQAFNSMNAVTAPVKDSLHNMGMLTNQVRILSVPMLICYKHSFTAI